MRLGFVKDEVITDLLGRQHGLPSIDLDPLTIDPAIIRIIPEEMARTHKVLPLSRSGATLTLAMADPTNRAGPGRRPAHRPAAAWSRS